MTESFIVAIVSGIGAAEGRANDNITLLQNNGFLCLEQKTQKLSQAQAELLAKDGYAGTVDSFLYGEAYISLLRGPSNAYDIFRSLVAATSDKLEYTYGSSDAWSALRDRAEYFPQDPILERSFLLIKPGLSTDQHSFIRDMIDSRQFVTIAVTSKVLTSEQACILAGNSNEEEISYLTSSSITAYVLERLNAVEHLHLLVGPSSPDLARKICPSSIRGQISVDTDNIHNSVYISESSERVKHDINMFFPLPFEIERTLCVIKPDAVEYIDSLLKLFTVYDFTVVIQQKIVLTKERCEQLYVSLQHSPNYQDMIRHMSSGPIILLILSKPSAIDTLLTLAGPSDPHLARLHSPLSIRARLGRSALQNAVDVSLTYISAKKEIDEFFPFLRSDNFPCTKEHVERVLNEREIPRAHVYTSKKSLQDSICEALVALCGIKPQGDEALLFLAEFLERNNVNKPVVVDEGVRGGRKGSVNEEKNEEDGGNGGKKLAFELSEKNQNKPIHVIWVVGPPNSGKTTLAGKLSSALDYEHISMSEIISSSKISHPKYLDIISLYETHVIPLPTHIMISLISDAMRNSKKTKFIFSNFPQNLDHAFTFEKNIACVKYVISLNVNGIECTKRAMLKNENKGIDVIEIEKKLNARQQQYEQDIANEIVDHYRNFNKLIQINGNNNAEQVFNEAFNALPALTKKGKKQ